MQCGRRDCSSYKMVLTNAIKNQKRPREVYIEKAVKCTINIYNKDVDKRGEELHNLEEPSCRTKKSKTNHKNNIPFNNNGSTIGENPMKPCESMNQYMKSYAKLESIQEDTSVWQKPFSEATVSKNRKRLPRNWSNQMAKEFYKIDGFLGSVVLIAEMN